MLPNSSGSDETAQRAAPRPETRSWFATGGWFSTPDATWTFWPCSASVTSCAVEIQRLQAVRIEPDLHREVARTEHRDRADAVETRSARP